MLTPNSVIVEDQSEVIDFLSDPASYGEAGLDVTRIDTHGAAVFLVGARAFKLKRAVKFPYMDFSTLARRRATCELELRLNRRTAPGLYRGLCPVTREAAGGLALGGAGAVVDWLIEMVRFDEGDLFDGMARRGALSAPLMAELADVIADFHERAERAEGGGAEAIARVIENNAREFSGFTDGVLDEEQASRVTAMARAALEAGRALLDRRRREGYVRRCHGDLHLRNIVLIDGHPTLFDALEFDETLATHDVLYDLAFLTMDLWHRALEDFSNLVFNRYLWRRPEFGILKVMPLFLSCRAGIRAHVSASMAGWREDPKSAEGLRREARAYLALALRFLVPGAPRLIAMGGLSGSGKSTLASALAAAVGQPPGAVVLRSDVVRKEIMGVDLEEELGKDAYRPQVTERVYETLRRRADEALEAGQSVIVDAVHARPDERAAVAAVAKTAGVPFSGLWLEASVGDMEARLEARRGDVSDATVAILQRQLSYDLGEITWRRLDASEGAGDARERARRLLDADVPAALG